MTPEEAIAFVKGEGIEVRKDAIIEKDLTTYGAQTDSWITDRSFFSLFTDAKVLALDVSEYEGAEIIADLNKPLDPRYYDIADFIYNGSCLDNLFDAASALRNMSNLLKAHGRVIHIEMGSPIQGAYLMYSPAFFFDYYAINQFNDCKIYTCEFDNFLDPWHIFAWDAFSQKGGKWVLSEPAHNHWKNVAIFVVAEKGENSTSDLSPIQGFYRQVHATDKDVYFESFQHYKASGRPVPTLVSDPMKKNLAPVPGFTSIGILANP